MHSFHRSPARASREKETTPRSLANMTTNLKTYLINLDRATDRLARMEQRLESVPIQFERVPAIDGNELKFPTPLFSDISYMLLHGRKRVPAEVGCYLSHLECARRFLSSGASHALILEDDVSFPENFSEIVSAALKHQDNWDILRLSTVNRGRKVPFAPLTKDYSLAIALFREKGAGAYIINRRAAEWFWKRLSPMRLAWDIAFDLEYLYGLRSAFIVPVPVSQKNEKISQIQSGVKESKLPRWRYLTVLPYRFFLETSRILMRCCRLASLKIGSFNKPLS